MECIEKHLWEHIPGSSVTVGISVDVEGVGSTADVVGGVNVVMLLLAVAIDAVTLLLILLLGGKVVVISAVLPILLGGKVVIVDAALSTLMLVLGTVINPRRACAARVTVVVYTRVNYTVCVCVCVFVSRPLICDSRN